MKQIINIDASILSKSACGRLLYLMLLKGYRKRLNSVAIEFGTAFHLFAKLQSIDPLAFRDNLNAAREYFRTTPHIPHPKAKYFTDGYLTKICQVWYMDYHEKDSFTILTCPTEGKLVEKKFRFIFYEDDYVVIYLCGTIDKVVQHDRSKAICVGDYKTTSIWDEDEYLKQYDISGQLGIYTIALQHYIEISTPDSVLFPFKGKDTGAFIEGIFLKSTEGVGIKRSDVKVSSDMNLDELREILTLKCIEISSMVQNATLPRREGMINGCCKHIFGLCDFFSVCSATDHRAFQAGLDRGFVQRVYNPLTFNEKE